MRVIEDGHIYEVNDRFGDGTGGVAGDQKIRFVNREPGYEHDGTTTQELLRVLIDRTQYCHACLPWSGNRLVAHHLRMALALHEARALIRKVERGDVAIELVTPDADHHLPLIVDTHGPTYAFKDRDETETGSDKPGDPCHTPSGILNMKAEVLTGVHPPAPPPTDDDDGFPF